MKKEEKITFRISKELKEELEKKAEELDIPVSQLIREGIKIKVKES